jgi:transcriptional regulator with XRE-family HTH domain
MPLICERCGGAGCIESGGELRSLRKSRRKTLEVVARKMGISASKLSDLENDRREWDFHLVKSYRRAVR